MEHKPDLIKVAVEAAGGRLVVSERLGVSPFTVSYWQRRKFMPPELIRPLCTAGGGIVTPEQVLAYIEENSERTVA